MSGETGTLSKEGDVNVITFRRSLNAAPERVWDALTTEEGIISWLAVAAKVQGRKGKGSRPKRGVWRGFDTGSSSASPRP